MDVEISGKHVLLNVLYLPSVFVLALGQDHVC
jgi:hypothetical protein